MCITILRPGGHSYVLNSLLITRSLTIRINCNLIFKETCLINKLLPTYTSTVHLSYKDHFRTENLAFISGWFLNAAEPGLQQLVVLVQFVSLVINEMFNRKLSAFDIKRVAWTIVVVNKS